MTRFDGTLALQLDFGETTTTTFRPARFVKAELKRVPPQSVRGPEAYGRDKYKVLEHRRRQAQIAARRLLEC